MPATLTLQRLRKLTQTATVRYGPPHPRLRIRIAPSSEEAIAEEEGCKDAIKIYSDGSGYHGKIESCPVLSEKRVPKAVLKVYLGKDTGHTVYEGEAVGLILALHLAKYMRTPQKFSIFTDHQAVILVLQNANAHADHHLIDAFRKQLDDLLRKHRRAILTVYWVPGHAAVPGNEAADRGAKSAAMGRPSPPSQLPPCFVNLYPPARLR
jgi:ribonuclease HI